LTKTHNGLIQIWKISYDNKPAVLKFIPTAYLNSKNKIEHLICEIAALKELNHTGIVKLKEALKDNNGYYLIMEVAYGAPLHTLLRAERKLSLQLMKYIACQLCIILEYTHSMGYVYRDLKASNVILSQEGKITLVDFGFSKKIGRERS